MKNLNPSTPPLSQASDSTLGRVLIVDDETELMAALSGLLQDQGYAVAGYTSGNKALMALREEDFDILLTDLRMPEMDGMTLLQAGLEIDPDLVGILMTGQGTVQTAVEIMKIGAFDYVLKPFKLRAMLPILSRAMGVRRLRLDNMQLRETATIYELSTTIASTLDSNTILSKVADAAFRQSEADELSILLRTPEGRELHVAFARGKQSRIIPEDQMPIQADIESAVSIPMLVGGESVGVLKVNTRPRYRKLRSGQMKALNILAGIAASALQNARLHEGLQQAAIQLEAKVEERTRDLETALGRVETMSRHKSQFLANMSHELRTPLNSIIGFADLLQDPQFGSITAKQGCYLGHIHSSGKHLLSLINDLLDLSKVEAGKLKLRPEAFPLADALTAALDQFGTQVDAKGVALSLQMEEAPDMLVADPLRFTQILYNLLSNAVKFTPTGGTITVAAKMVSRSESRGSGSQPETPDPKPYTLDSSDFVEIAVSDTGIGIKAEDLGRLFQEFTQLDTTLVKPHQGTGLGLALTKRLVEMHGGAVTVVSPGEGHGSTFTVTLPLQPPNVTPASANPLTPQS